MEIKAVRGVKDILPGEVEKWQFVERTARQVFERYGYAEIKVPIFEPTHLFSRSIGKPPTSSRRRCIPSRIKAAKS